VIIGYAIDRQVAGEVSEAAAADVIFLVNGEWLPLRYPLPA